MRRSGKSCFYGSYLHPQFAMGPRHSQEPSWVSGVNKISEERGRCACAYAQNGSTVTRGGGGSSRPITARPDPKPASVTTGDNNNTISTIMTFIKCLCEGQAVRYTNHMLCVSINSLISVYKIDSFYLMPFLLSIQENAELCILIQWHQHTHLNTEKKQPRRLAVSVDYPNTSDLRKAPMTTCWYNLNVTDTFIE